MGNFAHHLFPCGHEVPTRLHILLEDSIFMYMLVIYTYE